MIDPVSRENFRRLHEQEANNAQKNDEFLRICVKAEGDEGLARELAMVGLPFFGAIVVVHADVSRDWKC